MWYHEVIGGGRCPIVDTWWQTETGAIMISPLPGRDRRPSPAARPSRSRASRPRWWTSRATRCPPNQGGFLVVKRPWPSMLRTIYGDDERYKAARTGARTRACYFTADGARQDEDGYIWVMGRVDDVLNVSGHRLSTMEVESALVHHPKVAEAAVVGRPDDLKGEGDRLLRHAEGRAATPTDELKKELQTHVAKDIGALARPDDIRFTDALPKTRSRARSCGGCCATSPPAAQSTGDTTTLEDLSVLAKLREEEE